MQSRQDGNSWTLGQWRGQYNGGSAQFEWSPRVLCGTPEADQQRRGNYDGRGRHRVLGECAESIYVEKYDEEERREHSKKGHAVRRFWLSCAHVAGAEHLEVAQPARFGSKARYFSRMRD